MRDLVVNEALVAMACDAAKCLHGLIAAGEEVPYEVREPGDGSPLCRYEPLTEQFVRDHAGELRRLDSFGAACAALEAAGLAGDYLERMGIAAPAEPRQRAELAGTVFLCRMWLDSTDFTLDDDRLDAAIAELQAGGDGEPGQIEVIVPLRGLQMPVARLDLATASIVRADTVDVPSEARTGEGLGVSPWEPAFLAVVRVEEPGRAGGEDAPDPGFAAVEAFRRLITTLRLFKAGGVGLGPHAWTRTAGDRWRRIATGAGRQRPGGYRLVETELGSFAALSRALSASGSPFARQAAERPGFPAMLRRSLARFEAGLERNVVIEALNDHLLALRFVLEGGGPAGLGLSMRVAALCAEPDGRGQVKAVVDRAIGLERELWSGEVAPGAGTMSPAETAATLEELTRAILTDAAVGHLGSDLRTTADEILLADGLAVGEGDARQRGSTTEWDLEPVAEEADALDEAEEPEGVDATAEPGADEIEVPDWVEVGEERARCGGRRRALPRRGARRHRAGGIRPRPANLTRTEPRAGGGDGDRESKTDLRRAGRARDPTARAGAGRRRRADGDIRARAARRARARSGLEPGPAPHRADPRRAQGAPRSGRRPLPAPRDDRVGHPRDRLRPQAPRQGLRGHLASSDHPRKSRRSHRAERSVAYAFPGGGYPSLSDGNPPRLWRSAPA